MTAINIEDWHRQDILAAVRKLKGSMAALSVEHGLAPGTLANALTRPWPKGELIIAEALGLTPQEIWPRRYFSKEKLKNLTAGGKQG